MRSRWLQLLLCMGLLLAGPAFAQASSSAPVARLSHVAGTVQVQLQDGTDALTDAALNMPLPQGERILTGDSGEAEVEFADGSVLRLTPNSTAVLSKFESPTQMELSEGLFYLELRVSEKSSYSVNAGEQIIAPEENSSFRIRVSGGQVETGVLSGSVSVTRQNSYTADLGAGESLRSDPKNPKRYLLSSTLPQEAWDNWNEKLSQKAQDEAALRTGARDTYAGDEGYGWADLDANGTWYNVPGEGAIWQPAALDTGFDPYGYGSWTYGPGGYTWASGYSWGWLPYRCGRWSYYSGFGWGWLPTSGCRSFGGGFGGSGGFPVRNPPQNWRPPHRPVDITANKAHHPTLPIHPLADATRAEAPWKRVGESSGGGTAPVRIGGTLATVIPPITSGYTPQGQSAVGSALMRDFPVRTGTHEPVFGLQTQRPIAVPGRPAEWRRVDAAGTQAPPAPRERLRPAEGVIVYGGSLPTQNVDSGQTAYRVPRPTDPPVNANGVPPVNAIGPPPHNATGVPGATPAAGLTNGQRPVGIVRSTQPAQQGPPVRVQPPLPPTQVQMQPVYRAPASQGTAMPRSSMPPPSPPPQPRPAPAAPAPSAPRAVPSTR